MKSASVWFISSIIGACAHTHLLTRPMLIPCSWPMAISASILCFSFFVSTTMRGYMAASPYMPSECFSSASAASG